jgi:hypothetical protein
MLTSFERYASLAVALIGILGLLIRLSFQLGHIFSEFEIHIESSAELHKDIEARVRIIERRRR